LSCYTRHLDDVLREAGIEPTRPNRRRVDMIIRDFVGESHCPQAWKRVKTAIAGPDSRRELVAALRDAWEERSE
jgi:hypothetical protein